MTILRGYPSTMPSATLDFAGSKKLDPRIAFSRASAASPDSSTMVDGNVQTFGINVPRLGDSGLLIEGARTNYQFNSEAFAVDTGWRVFNTYTRGTNTTEPAPDGSNTACEFFEVTGGGIYNGVEASTALNLTVSSGRLTISVYNKPINCDTFFISANSTGGNYANCTSIVNNTWSFSTAVVESAKAEPIGNGWYRMSATMIVPTNSQFYRPLFSSQMFAGPTDTPDSSQGCTLWGAQAEEGGFVSSYIPNTGTSGAVTRAADVAEMPADYNLNEFTITNNNFGAAGGSHTLTIVGIDTTPVKRTAVYSSDLTRTEAAALANVYEWWEWRVYGTALEFLTVNTDGQITVDWGDGTVEVLTTTAHTFTNGGGYHTIRFRLDSGTYMRLRLATSSQTALRSVGPVPNFVDVSPVFLFFNCSELETIDPSIGLDGTNPYGIAYGCTKLKNFPMANFDLATSMGPVLGGGQKGGWNGCSSLESFPAIHFPLIEDLDSGWLACSSMKTFNATWTNAVTSMARTFENCTSLESMPMRATGNVASFFQTWLNCSSLTSFPLLDTSSGENFSSTFRGCSGIGTFPQLDTSNGTTFTNMFFGCSSMTALPQLDLSKGEVFSGDGGGGQWGFCNGCTSLVTVPAISLDSMTLFRQAFRNCTSLQNWPAGVFDNWTGTPASYCFDGAWLFCNALTPASVENILDSIAGAAGAQNAPATGPNITIYWNQALGVPYGGTLSSGVITPVPASITTLKGRGWGINLAGTLQ